MPKYLFEDLLDGRYLYVSADSLTDSDADLRFYIGEDGMPMTFLPVQGVKRLEGGAVILQAGRNLLCFAEERSKLSRTVRARWHYSRSRQSPLRALDAADFDITEDLNGTFVKRKTTTTKGRK
jgi:hypothetical protein